MGAGGGYLTLSRGVNEQVILRVGAVEITVMVIEIRGDQARIGFRAPPEVSVNRAEIQRAIDRGEPRT